MIYLGEVCVFFPTSLIIFQSFRFICDLVKEDLTPPVAYYTLSTQYFKIVVLILWLFCSLCVAPNIQRTKVHVLYMCLCVCAKPQGETRLVRGKIKRTHQGLPWCNRGLFFCAPKASPWPAGWIDPWTHSATSCTSLSPFLSLSLVFSHLSLSLNVPPFSSRTHGFHTEAPVCGQQPNGLPSASYCWWSGFVFVFDGLTFVHKAQEDSDRPGMDTHTLTLSHTYTYTELKSSAPRPQASSPASVRAMMSLWGDTMPLHYLSPPPANTHTLNIAQTHIHYVVSSYRSQGAGENRYRW